MFGLFLIFCALFLLLGLLSYNATDPSLNHVDSSIGEVKNKAGLFGAYSAGLLNDVFGIGALLIPAVFAALGLAHISESVTLHWWRWAGLFLLTVCFLLCASALDWFLGDLAGGGMVGQTLLYNANHYLSRFGAFLLWTFLFLTGIQLAANFSWIGLAQLLRQKFKNWQIQKKNCENLSNHGRFGKLIASSAKGSTRIKGIWANMLSRAKADSAQQQPLLPPLSEDSLSGAGTEERGSNATLAHQLHFSPFAAQPALLDEDDPFAPSQQLKPETPNITVRTPEDTEEENRTEGSESANLPPCQIVAPVVAEAGTVGQESPAMPESVENRTPGEGPEAPDLAGFFQAPQPEASLAPDLFGVEMGEPKQARREDPIDIRLFEEKSEPKEIVFPSPALLNPPVPIPVATPEDLEAKGKALMSCFNDFDIHGELARITPGPVVTMFEVRPAPGIRVSKIANLSDDLSLALKAVAVRIQAPIPGTDTVGIEIPNDLRETVNFRELVEAPDFKRGAGPLTMILGKTIAGAPFMADLTKMPHMLVAGATGAGKSVCLNSILVSLLYRVPPKDMRLLLVDPKRIELAVYADLPHLVHPVVTEMDDAKQALDWAVDDMKKRYKTFERLGVRNIVAYHQKLASFGENRPADFQDLGHMPYMVIVIDELADLMMTAAREVETSIVRLAQLARAAGIHMILATQRPSVDVVTGLIKANFPCRISFQVTSKHDSRTILDQVGAEHLLGRGDMLFKPSGGKLMRLHGPFLTDEEVQAVAAHWKAQLPADYQVDFAQWSAETAAASPAIGGDATTDALYGAARDFVLEQGKASISLLQRHLKIGFNRAARLMEQFERDGIIGPADGSKPRNVIR